MNFVEKQFSIENSLTSVGLKVLKVLREYISIYTRKCSHKAPDFCVYE